MRLNYALLLNILDPLLAISGEKGLLRLAFLTEAYEYKTLAHAYARGLGDEVELTENARAFAPLRAQLAEYFTGTRQRFDLPLDMRGSAFQLSVWRRLQTIPYGHLRSYKQIAEQIGQRGAARAVGQAAGQNPLPIIVPCHRVVAADGDLTGFAGGMFLKAQLLRLEGHTLGENRRVVAPRLF